MLQNLGKVIKIFKKSRENQQNSSEILQNLGKMIKIFEKISENQQTITKNLAKSRINAQNL